MAFFPRAVFNTANDTSFHPLFRLLDDFDNYSRQGGSQQGRRAAAPVWQPKFDVRETAETYELHGELPGIAKENVNIEFTEPQTLTVRGRSERTYTAGTPPAGQLEDTAMSGALSDAETASNHSHQATVEDADDSNWEDVAAKKPEEKPVEKAVEAPKPAPKKPADTAKYWLTERSIGEFARSFNFPSRVDQDNVTANFKDGILTIAVPKAKKHEARRIAVN